MYITKCTFLNFAPEGRTETLQLTYIPQMLAAYIQCKYIYYKMQPVSRPIVHTPDTSCTRLMLPAIDPKGKYTLCAVVRTVHPPQQRYMYMHTAHCGLVFS